MAKSPFTRRDEQYELSRRALIKWTIAAGAGLGVARSRVHEVLEKYAGKGTAQAASTRPFNNTIVCLEDSGGLANHTYIQPFAKIGLANNDALSWRGGTDGAKGTLFPGTDFASLTFAGDPFAGQSAKFRPATFMGGNNETHTGPGGLGNFVSGGRSLPAFAAELQVTGISNVIPAIAIDTNVGASVVPFATAGSVAAAVGLFDSAASKSLLQIANQQELYNAHFKILSGLGKLAKNSKAASKTANDASALLGKNLASQLAVTAADVTRYAGTTTVPNGVLRYIQAFRFAVNAMTLGLTPNIAFGGFRNDPHNHFDGGDFQTVPQLMWKVYKTFLTDLEAAIDPITGEPLARHVVMAVVGDTFKNALNRNGWGDGTVMGSNVTYLPLHGGWVKSGQHGDVAPNNTATILDAAGKEIPYNAAAGQRAGTASFGYAVAKGDSRALQGFTSGNVDDLKVHWNLPVI